MLTTAGEIFMKVGIYQASVCPGYARCSELGSRNVVHLGIKFVHQLSRLHEFILVRIAQLRELVDVLSWANFQRQLNCQGLITQCHGLVLVGLNVVLPSGHCTHISAGERDLLLDALIIAH